MNHSGNTVTQSNVPVICMDLRRSTAAIHRDLVTTFGNVQFRWELQEDETTGWIYSSTRVIAKIAHVGTAAKP